MAEFRRPCPQSISFRSDFVAIIRRVYLWAFPWALLSTALAIPAALSADETSKVEPKRYALLVAVTSYQHAEMNMPQLQFPEADAQAVGEFLEDYGYDVEYLLGPQATKLAIEKKLDELADQGNEEGTVVLGFWGHGVEFESTSESMFCPFDTKIRTVVDARGKKLFDKDGKPMIEPDSISLVGMSTVLLGLRVSGAGNRLLLADCCRQSPNRARGRAFGSRTELTDLPDNTAALFACSELEQAYEDKEWGHGAFTKCLLDLLPTLATGDGDDVNSITSKLKHNVATLVKDRSNGRDRQTVNPITSAVVVNLKIQPKSSMPTEITNSIGMKLKLIPAGEFLMGSSDADVAAALRADPELKEEDLKDERPQHKVNISRPFYAGVYEVTQGDYETVMGVNPSRFSASGDDSERVGGMNTKRFPVENVSWYDAIEFCNKLSQRENLTAYYMLTSVEREEGRIMSATVSIASAGRQSPDASGYRLPTEAEWEYMCRAGSTSAYNFGSILNGDKANVDGNYPYGMTTKGSCLERPTTVGSYSANGFGLHDSHGNVWEWCFDVYDESAYGSRHGVTLDPLSSSGSEYRVLRGGCWFSGSWNARSACRNGLFPDDRDIREGFRVVR